MTGNARCNLASLTPQILNEHWRRARVVVLGGCGAICAGRHLTNRDVAVELCIAEPDGWRGVILPAQDFSINCRSGS